MVGSAGGVRRAYDSAMRSGRTGRRLSANEGAKEFINRVYELTSSSGRAGERASGLPARLLLLMEGRGGTRPALRRAAPPTGIVWKYIIGSRILLLTSSAADPLCQAQRERRHSAATDVSTVDCASAASPPRLSYEAAASPQRFHRIAHST
ncbi:hypothetical protein RR46_06764 [Papilio xuthus]|uniref:Uncharacterized protein n=1 Tax=Papilio xuthus TaxID=66420 RepID=A0A194PY03_PAPXU|nr:hypothetical protein RR46_06764 [Papilio xuthus]